MTGKLCTPVPQQKMMNSSNRGEKVLRKGRADVMKGGEYFASEDRRIWIYINRVKRGADANLVSGFIKRNPDRI